MRILGGNSQSLLESEREQDSIQKEVETREEAGVQLGGKHGSCPADRDGRSRNMSVCGIEV